MTGYVRGKYQLAAWADGSAATGRRLTDFEATEAYGPLLPEVDARSAAVLLAEPNAIESALRSRREAVGVPIAVLASRTRLSTDTVGAAETDASDIAIRDIERIAFALGLDERLIALDRTARADTSLGVRLRTLTYPPTSTAHLSAELVLSLLEAASVVRVQRRLQRWLGLDVEYVGLTPSSDFGDSLHPAWKVGYSLAESARASLGIGNRPIASMRELVESTFRIPVLQSDLPNWVAGATVDTLGDRGILLNASGQNENVWVRRATLAHELCHFLFDPEDILRSVCVDSYENSEADPERSLDTDFAEQRANAFAVAFLAPPSEVRRIVPGTITAEGVERVMSAFGIGRVAAHYHVWNANYRNYDPLPVNSVHITPTDEQIAAENFTLDYFRPSSTPLMRRGRFAYLVAAAVDSGMISDDTAAQYLFCSINEVREHLNFLLQLQ